MAPITFFDNTYKHPEQPEGEATCVQRHILFASTCPVRELHFSGNTIPAFRVFFPYHFQHIEHLDLSNNKIKFLHQYVFQSLRSLYNIDLSSNELYEMFSDINVSEVLKTQFQLCELYENFFLLPPKLNGSALFQNSRLLKVINLSSNNLSRIPNDLFDSNAELKEINMSKNELSQISFKISHLHNLTVLDFRYNKMPYLDTNSRNILDSLSEIQNSRHGFVRNNSKLQILMEGNPFICTCEAQEFLQWFAKAPYFSARHTYRCNLNGKAIKMNSNADARAAKDDCERSERRLRTILLSTILPGIGILVVTVSTFAICRRRRRKLQKRNLDDRIQMIQMDNLEFQFPVFLSFCSADREFVIEHIYFPLQVFEPRYDKTNTVTVRPAKTQISLGIRPV